jgi:hypothetical protein
VTYFEESATHIALERTDFAMLYNVNKPIGLVPERAPAYRATMIWPRRSGAHLLVALPTLLRNEHVNSASCLLGIRAYREQFQTAIALNK